MDGWMELDELKVPQHCTCAPRHRDPIPRCDEWVRGLGVELPHSSCGENRIVCDEVNKRTILMQCSESSTTLVLNNQINAYDILNYPDIGILPGVLN